MLDQTANYPIGTRIRISDPEGETAYKDGAIVILSRPSPDTDGDWMVYHEDAVDSHDYHFIGDRHGTVISLPYAPEEPINMSDVQLLGEERVRVGTALLSPHGDIALVCQSRKGKDYHMEYVILRFYLGTDKAPTMGTITHEKLLQRGVRVLHNIRDIYTTIPFNKPDIEDS